MAASALASGRSVRTDHTPSASLRVVEESLATAANEREIIDYAFWGKKCAEMARGYTEADPFPHTVLTDLLRENVAKQLATDVAVTNGDGWTHYKHVNEHKEVNSKREQIPPGVLRVIDELNGPRFVALLSQLTGIKGLIPDHDFSATSGISRCTRGGFLNIHHDFTVHPYRPTWRRRVNLILYVNGHWDDSWGGQTELWDREMKRMVRKVSPRLNSALVFNTDTHSFHGHPEPLACPEGVYRLTLSLYYFTEEVHPRIISTEYKPRPADGLAKRILIYADKSALRGYDFARRKLGFSNDLGSNFLRALSAIRRKRHRK